MRPNSSLPSVRSTNRWGTKRKRASENRITTHHIGEGASHFKSTDGLDRGHEYSEIGVRADSSLVAVVEGAGDEKKKSQNENDAVW